MPPLWLDTYGDYKCADNNFRMTPQRARSSLKAMSRSSLCWKPVGRDDENERDDGKTQR